jgi:dTDP-4-dehydrorhamnose reductase
VFSGAKGDYTEDDTADATSLYGQMKLRAEHRLAQFEGAFSLRLGTVFGLSQQPNAFLNRLLRDLVHGKNIPLIRDEVRTFYSVDDVCGACVRLLEQDPFPGGVFHLGGVRKDSYHSFGVALVHAFGLDDNLLRAVRGAEFSEAFRVTANRGNDLSLVGDAFGGRFGYRVHAIEDSLMRLKTLLKHGRM